MPRENLLAFYKAAGHTRGFKKPSVERYTYAGELAVLLQDHMNRGHPNPLVESRAELLAGGVPVQARYTKRAKRKKRSTPSRPDVSWRNKQMGRWRQEHPSRDVEQEAAFRRQLAASWRAMTDEERLAAVFAVDDQGRRGGDQQHDNREQKVRASAEDEPWSGHNGIWPVANEVLEAIQGFGSRNGTCQAVRWRRWNARKKNLWPPTCSPSLMG